MATIKVYDVTYDTLTLYRKANTQAQRALVGYIVKAGKVNDPIFGGAFNVLRGIEYAMEAKEIYKLYPIVDRDMEKVILHVVQLALDGKLDKFTVSEREQKDTIKYLCEPF